MAIEPKIINDYTVIVAYDVKDDERRNNLHAFLVDENKAKERTRSVYDLILKIGEKEYQSFCKSIESIVDLRTDTVILWDLIHSDEPLVMRRTII